MKYHILPAEVSGMYSSEKTKYVFILKFEDPPILVETQSVRAMTKFARASVSSAEFRIAAVQLPPNPETFKQNM